MTRGVQTQLTEGAKRLIEWCDGIQISARLGYPQYANPSELKAEVRALADAYLALTKGLQEKVARALYERAMSERRTFSRTPERFQGRWADVSPSMRAGWLDEAWATIYGTSAVSVGSPETGKD